MDVGRIMIGLVKQLQDSDCDLCFKLVLGGRSDYFNNERDSADECDYNDCCVRVGVLDIGFTDVYEEQSQFGVKIAKDWNLELFFGIPARMDLQFFNEVNPDDIDNSKWVKYLSPLICCLSDFEADFCNMYVGCGGCREIEVKASSGKMKMNYTDKNLDGWQMFVRIRESLL
jgi:hypothetical protein